MLYCVFQFAVAVLGLSMIIGFEVDVLPDAAPLHEVKTYRVPVVPGTVVEFTVAYAFVFWSYQSVPLVFPWAEDTLRWYWVFQLAITVLDAFM